jgi:hypothetical protein
MEAIEQLTKQAELADTDPQRKDKRLFEDILKNIVNSGRLGDESPMRTGGQNMTTSFPPWFQQEISSQTLTVFGEISYIRIDGLSPCLAHDSGLNQELVNRLPQRPQIGSSQGL